MSHLEALCNEEGHQGCNARPAGHGAPSKAHQVRTCTSCSLRGVPALPMCDAQVCCCPLHLHLPRLPSRTHVAQQTLPGRTLAVKGPCFTAACRSNCTIQK